MGRDTDRELIRTALLELADARGSVKSFCPSEAARQVASDWRPMMPLVRQIAAELQADGRLDVLQRGMAVSAQRARCPIRLRKASGKPPPPP